MKYFIAAVLFASMIQLSACSTVEGVGEDLSRAGDNIRDAARDVRGE